MNRVKLTNPKYGSLPRPQPQGKTFYVSSRFVDEYTHIFENDTDGTPRYFATIAEATAYTESNRGDVIYVFPGHEEEVSESAGINIDVNNVSLIGLGEGVLRPKITFTTSGAASLVIGGAGCVVKNFLLYCGIDGQTFMVTVFGLGTTIEDCYLLPLSTEAPSVGILLSSGSDASVVRNNVITFHNVGSDAGIRLSAASGGTIIEDNVIMGHFDNAGIHNPTSAVVDGAVIARNRVQNLEAGDHAIELISATNGLLTDNQVFTDSLATAIDAGAMSAAGNTWNSSAGGDTEAIPALPLNASSFVPGLGYRVTKVEDVNTATGVDLLTVTGKVLLTLWSGEVTNALDAAVTDYKLRVKTSNIDLCAASNIASAGIGFLFNMNGDAGDTLINTASATETADTNGKGLAGRIVGKAGGTLTLQSLRTAGASGDSITHTVFYLPLEDGAGVVAA